jgi:hypothetical protein
MGRPVHSASSATDKLHALADDFVNRSKCVVDSIDQASDKTFDGFNNCTNDCLRQAERCRDDVVHHAPHAGDDAHTVAHQACHKADSSADGALDGVKVFGDDQHSNADRPS